MKHKTFLAVILAVLSLVFLVGLPVYAQTLGRIEGHITNLTTGGPPAEPLPAVEILVNEWMILRSGADGEWNITGLKPGVYTVRLNLPPGYNPAQDVLTTTIWGENIEVVDLAYYEGDTPPASIAATSVMTDDRVTPLGQPTTAAPAAVSTAVPTVITSTTTATDTTALPGRAGQVSVLPAGLWVIWAGWGMLILGLGGLLLKKGEVR